MWNMEAGMFSAKMPGAALMVALVVGGEYLVYYLVETLWHAKIYEGDKKKSNK